MTEVADLLARVRIGAWYSLCCEEDTYEICTADDIAYVQSMIEDYDDGVGLPYVFDSKADAAAYWGVPLEAIRG